MIRRRKTRRKSSPGKENKLERFLNSRLIILLGAVFILIGLYFSLSSSGESNGIFNILANLFKPSSDEPVILAVTGNKFPLVLYYFLPAILMFSGIIGVIKKYPRFTYWATLLLALYLTVLQPIILSLNIYLSSAYFTGFNSAIPFLLIPLLLFFVAAYLHRKPVLGIFACFYFYPSAVLLEATYRGHFVLLLSLTLIISITIAWLGYKYKHQGISLLNFFFALGFMGLFWLRKFVVNSKPEFLLTFLVFGILFYLLFYVIGLIASSANEQPLRRWMQLVLAGINNFFFLGTTSYVVLKYYEFSYLWLLVLGAFLVNLAGLYWVRKNNWTTWQTPLFYSVLFLAALVLPLLVHQNMSLLFSAGLSGLMLYYACTYKDRLAMLISMVALSAMFVLYIFLWGFSYLPAFFSGTVLPEDFLLWNGLISGTAVVVTLGLSQWFIQDAIVPLSKKWFSRKKYNRIIRGTLFVSLFLSMGWLMFSLLAYFGGTTLYNSVSWFISGAVFFIFFINYYSGKQSVFKKPLLYLALSFALFYPLLVHWSMIIYRAQLIKGGPSTSIAPLLHYLAVLLLLILGFMIVHRILRHNYKNHKIQGGIKVLTFVFLGFLLCTEYDNIRVLLTFSGTSVNSNINLTDSSQYLPYSILLGILTILAFIRAVYRNDLLLRNFSIISSIIILIKIFAYDFKTLDQGSKSIVFIILGLFLIGFAILFQHILKANSKLKETERKRITDNKPSASDKENEAPH